MSCCITYSKLPDSWHPEFRDEVVQMLYAHAPPTPRGYLITAPVGQRGRAGGRGVRERRGWKGQKAPETRGGP